MTEAGSNEMTIGGSKVNITTQQNGSSTELIFTPQGNTGPPGIGMNLQAWCRNYTGNTTGGGVNSVTYQARGDTQVLRFPGVSEQQVLGYIPEIEQFLQKHGGGATGRAAGAGATTGGAGDGSP